MIENREPWIAKTLEWEGGGVYTNRPDDRGGPTKYGIVMSTLAKWRGVKAVTEEDIVQLGEDESKDIYRADYWGYLSADKLPGGVDWIVATIAVLSGQGRAARMLQEVVGLKGRQIDGMVGDKTVAAVRAMRPMDVLLKLQSAYLKFLVRIPGESNDAGWMDRWTECLTIAEAHIDARPMQSEAAGSRIIVTNGVSAGAKTIGLGVLIEQYGPQVVAWLKTQAEDPNTLERLQSGVQYAGGHSIPILVIGVGLLLLVTGGNDIFTVWNRIKMWRRGQV